MENIKMENMKMENMEMNKIKMENGKKWKWRPWKLKIQKEKLWTWEILKWKIWNFLIWRCTWHRQSSATRTHVGHHPHDWCSSNKGILGRGYAPTYDNGCNDEREFPFWTIPGNKSFQFLFPKVFFHSRFEKLEMQSAISFGNVKSFCQMMMMMLKMYLIFWCLELFRWLFEKLTYLCVWKDVE